MSSAGHRLNSFFIKVTLLDRMGSGYIYAIIVPDKTAHTLECKGRDISMYMMSTGVENKSETQIEVQ